MQPETTSNIQESVENSGSGPVSFNELDNVENYQARAAEVEQSKTTADKVIDQKAAKAEGKSEKTPKAKAAPKKAKETEAEAPVEVTNEALEDALPEVKMYNLKNGKDEVGLRADMTVPVKIDGQMVDVPFEDVINGYSGAQAIAQRFTQLDTERKTFETDKADIEGMVNDVFREAESDNPFQAVVRLAEFAGKDPVDFQMELYDSLAGEIQKWTAMTDEQRAAYRTQLENERLTKQNEMLTNQQTDYQTQVEVDQSVNSAVDRLGVPREEFAKRFQELEQLQADGEIEGEITVDVVSNYIEDLRKVDLANTILNKIDPTLAQDRSNSEALVEIMYKMPDLNEQDYEEIAMDHWGNQTAKKLSKKAAQRNPRIMENKREHNPQNDPVSWDEFDSIHGAR